MTDVLPWYTVKRLGHVVYEGVREHDWDTAKAEVAKTYPHHIEISAHDRVPLDPGLVFDEDKQPWTSIFSHESQMVLFAFSDVRDAVEFRLRASF